MQATALERNYAGEITDDWEEFFDNYGVDFTAGMLPEYPPVQIGMKDKNLFIHAEIPGMNMEDFEITIAGRNLSISGEKKLYEGESSCLRCSERHSGYFNRLISLPEDVDIESIDAHYEKGILTISLTAREDAGERRIEVHPG